MTATQRRLPLALIVCGVVGLVASYALTGKPASGGTTESSSAPRSFAVLPDVVPRIAIAYELDGRGDSGFNALAWAGMQRAGLPFDAELKEISAEAGATDADREKALTELAEARYGPIFVVGAGYAGAVAEVAPKYPHTWFGLLDDGSVNAPNVIGIQFNEEQGSFLVGAAAALTSKTGTVGFIGTAPTPLLQKYEAGFTAGAMAADPDVVVKVAYHSPSPDAGVGEPAKDKAAALAMYDDGADVIFGTVGSSGDGVIQAAHDRGLWAIGVDSDRYLTSDPSVRDAILTSMLKRADVATYVITMEVANRVPKDGNNVFGLDQEGVGYSTSGGFVDPIKAQLDGFAARIADGEILVPTKP